MYTTMHIHTHIPMYVHIITFLFYTYMIICMFWTNKKQTTMCISYTVYIYIHTWHFIFAAQVALVEEAIRQRFSEDPRILLRRLGEKRPPSQEVAAKLSADPGNVTLAMHSLKGEDDEDWWGWHEDEDWSNMNWLKSHIRRRLDVSYRFDWSLGRWWRWKDVRIALVKKKGCVPGGAERWTVANQGDG